MTSTIHNNLKDFNPISLDEMNTISLLRRYDQKFTITTSQFQDIFPFLANYYHCLTIENQQINLNTLQTITTLEITPCFMIITMEN
ncbi:MAG: hypothetical protein CM15mP65_20560 [Crocinitomicaceae bacterium]|nr:MAG: hypothetical protein CM15mP65_20560 [Crocinitomicaceae bacterium]